MSHAYDNLDSDALPTVRFTYNWGAVPNRVLTETRTAHGASSVHTSVACMDGFGRPYETRTQFSGATFNSVRTSYDNRGLTAAQANPVSDGANADCAALPPDITALDRATMAYDTLGNVTTTTFLAANQFTGPSTLSTYNGLSTSFRDERLNTTTYTSNPLARTLVVTEPTAANTTHASDKLGRLTSITDALGNVTTIGYDLAGRKTSMSDRDMGSWTYGYNAAGSLTSQTDARNITTTLAYDEMERLKTKSYSNYEPSVSYEYDTYPAGSTCADPPTAIGMATRMVDAAGEDLTCYDKRGRTLTTRRSIDGNYYQMDYAYDALDQVVQMTYPDGDVVEYDQTAQGDITGMTSDVDGGGGAAAQTLLIGAQPTAFGAAASLPFGNNRTTSLTYDYRLRLKTIQTNNSLQDLTLTYDDASNITGVSDTVGLESITYTYDALNRLTGGTGFQGGATAFYQYNLIGNLTSKQEGSSALTLNYPASGPTSTRPHAVTSVGGSLTRTAHYDANGNMKASADHIYDYDAENRLRAVVKSQAHSSGVGLRCSKLASSATDEITSGDQLQLSFYVGTTKVPNTPSQYGRTYNAAYDFDASGAVNAGEQLRLGAAITPPKTPCTTTVYRYTYDGAGQLLKRDKFNRGWESQPVAERVIYIGGVYEKNITTGAVKKYYHAFGRTIAFRDVPTGTGQGALYYPLLDHLGSTVGLMDQNGASTASIRYWPYGGERTGALTTTDQKYTGQRQEPFDPTLGIYNYNARFYSTTLGRFLSVDPIGGSPTDPQSANPYTYVLNNPLAYVDPTGMEAECDRSCQANASAAAWVAGVAITQGGCAAATVGTCFVVTPGTAAIAVSGTAAIYLTYYAPEVAGALEWAGGGTADALERVFGGAKGIWQWLSDDGEPHDADEAQAENPSKPKAEPLHGHHADPRFIGGEEDQELVPLTGEDHRALHAALNEFLRGKVNEEGNDMSPRRGNSGQDIRGNFTRNELLEAAAEFYKGPGAQWPEAAESFFDQHPELQ